MPQVGDLCGRRRLPVVGLVMAFCVAFALCSVLPRVAHASVNAHAAGSADGCVDATVPASAASAPAMRRAVVCLVNRERARYGLPRLREDRKLNVSAQDYTSEMVRRDFFSHTAPNGSTPGARIAATGFHWSWAGENIASGYPTPLSVVNAWMNSQGHCYNLLAPVFRDIGVGVSPRPVAGASEPATWTQDFALPRGAHAPSHNWGPSNSCPHGG
jgi:uncharacterized protein YkwD